MECGVSVRSKWYTEINYLTNSIRNEWKLGDRLQHDELNSATRFYSAHSKSHYAIFWWVAGTDDADFPLESLDVFDISVPSTYRPSEDPFEVSKHDHIVGNPKIIKQILDQDFDFYDVRQGITPKLCDLKLDESHVYLIEEDHRWLVGNQASNTLPTLHTVKSTGIPFVMGPRWVDECGAGGDLYRSFCERTEISRRMYLLTSSKME